MKAVCVYCGSSSGVRPVYADAARAFGRALVAADLTLVYGGGRVGLMGTIADEFTDYLPPRDGSPRAAGSSAAAATKPAAKDVKQ